MILACGRLLLAICSGVLVAVFDYVLFWYDFALLGVGGSLCWLSVCFGLVVALVPLGGFRCGWCGLLVSMVWLVWLGVWLTFAFGFDFFACVCWFDC